MLHVLGLWARHKRPSTLNVQDVQVSWLQKPYWFRTQRLASSRAEDPLQVLGLHLETAD